MLKSSGGITRRRHKRILCALALLALPASNFAQKNELETLKATTDRWIELRSRHAQEESNWRLDREVLQDSIKTLQASKENLEKDLQYFASEQEKMSAATADAKSKLAQLETLDGSLLELVHRYETRIRALSRKLPLPLADSVRPLLAKVPSAKNDSGASVPARLQNLIAIMTVIDEFNNKLTLTRAIRPMDNGEAIEARVLYFGLAAGYATNASGTKAWTLVPSEGGWTWETADADAEAIHTLFEVYEKAIDPVVVEAPFSYREEEASQ